MTTAVVSIICIALIVVGGMMMSQGILISADTTALSVDEISTREGTIMRTDIGAIRAENLSWADRLRVTVPNSGQTKLASFDKWDVIVSYSNGGADHTRWLPYTEGAPTANEWEKAGIYLDGQTEVFEPGILNAGEKLVILARLNPLPGNGTTGHVAIATPNGVENTSGFSIPGYTRLVPHAENISIASAPYHEMAEAPADGLGQTLTTDLFTAGENARKLLHDESDSSRPARYLFSLTGISEIQAATWTVYYRGRTLDFQGFDDNEASFNIDVLIRRADGTVRTTLAASTANAPLTGEEVDTWVTKSATYDFPGYAVVDDSDYLEIDYYGITAGGGPANDGYMQLRLDDSTLDEAIQTRIEA